MKIQNLTYPVALLALFAFAGTASAQTTGAAATLSMTATVQDSMQLMISTHVSPAGAAVTPVTVDSDDNEFSIDFGNVNGLGLGTRSAGVSVVAGSNGALYTSPIYVTPIFSGFGAGVASITVRSGGGADNDLAGEGSSAVNTLPLTTTAGAAVIAAVASESLNTRFVSFAISRAQAPGALAASFIYEMTID